MPEPKAQLWGWSCGCGAGEWKSRPTQGEAAKAAEAHVRGKARDFMVPIEQVRIRHKPEVVQRVQ